MAFIDEARFFVKGGDGGRGCMSFRREKFVPLGGPDGGDGGDGGSVYLQATTKLSSLMDFRYRSHFNAPNGVHGLGKKMHGRKGEDTLVMVPVGSIIKDADTDEVLVDLIHDGDRFLAAQGGEGGGGNVHYATALNRAPRLAGKGTPGEQRWLKIELKLMADVGLVGLPNAGKSTLLSKLSAANPKVAPYPFTTVEPQLGVLHFEDRNSCIIADLPGLIEGAHQGAGLGHKFLRHVERTKILLHVIDASEPEEEPLRQYRLLENELRCYQEELLSRKRLLVLNKIDLLESEERGAELQALFAEVGLPILLVSGLDEIGLTELKAALAEVMDEYEE